MSLKYVNQVSENLTGVYPCDVTMVGYGLLQNEEYAIIMSVTNQYKEPLNLCFSVSTAQDLSNRLAMASQAAKEES